MRINKPNQWGGIAANFTACVKSNTISSVRFLGAIVSGLLLLALMAVSASAQTTNTSVNLSAVPLRVTVPVGFIGDVTVSNHVTIATNPPIQSPVTLSVFGYPRGVTGTLDPKSFTGSGAAYLTLHFDGTETEGIANLDLNATGGATNDFLIPVEVGFVWSGDSSPDLNWSSAGNWTNGTAPGPNDDVIFTSAGATTNDIGTNTFSYTSIVDQNTTISSLRFAQYADTNDTQNLLINPGVTLSVIGTNGFRMLMDYGREQQTNQMYVSIGGTNGTLVVSNKQGSFAILVDSFEENTLDMSRLGTFVADLNRIGLGDYALYPNYWIYQSNGYTGRPQQFIPSVTLARTNIIKADFVDPYDYNNNSNRNYAFIFGHNENQATSSGSQMLLTLGITNSFQMDGICFGGFGAAGTSLQFNPAMARLTNVVGSVTNVLTNQMVAIFRNTNGGRMSMFCLADASTPVAASGNTKANQFNGIDFASYNGYVDALVDRFIMARNNPDPNRTDGCTAQARMELGAGIFNVNTAIIGDQENTGPAGTQTNKNYSQGTLVVSNTALFQVNGEMSLGYTAASNTDGTIAGDTYGRIDIGPGGTVIASNIVVGGITHISGEVGTSDIHGGLNQIAITDGGLLVVSNSIGDSSDLPGSGLGLLSLDGNATLELFIDGSTHTNVFTKRLVTSGGTNVIKIGVITNVAFSGSAPVEIPLIYYTTGTPHFSLSVPPGYTGTILDNGPGSTIDALIKPGTAHTLAWRGYVNNNWDTTTRNWLDLNTGLHTNFATLDNVAFDDTASAPTNISLASSGLTPGLITMTNNTRTYFISGSGTIIGSAPMFKTGAGTLDVQGSTYLAITVNQGSLIGSGTIFSADIGSGATMQFYGTINGNVACAGAGLNSGVIKGSLDVQPGGVFTNLNMLNSTFTVEPNSFMQNSGSINYYTGGTLNSVVSSNAYLLNLGTINGDEMQVDGTLNESSGTDNGIKITQLTIASGGTFIPGGSGIGTTWIDPGNGVGSTPGRLTLSSGSTTIIKVNPGHSPLNTLVYAGYFDFGPSQSGQAQNGGTLVITNIDGTPFAAGQVFNVFDYKVSSIFGAYTNDTITATGASTNSYPIISPATPGPGLTWDLRQLWPYGYIAIRATPHITLTNSFTLLGDSNIVATFTWPTNYTDRWVLETQANPLSVGLSSNWSRIPGTWTNTSDDIGRGYKMRVFTNDLNTTNPAVFYRLVYP